MKRNWRAILKAARAVLLHRGRSEEDAEDLLHDAWIKFNRYPDKDQVVEPTAFIVRTALNQAIDQHRSKARHGEKVELDAVSVADASQDTEEQVLFNERVRLLYAAIDRLPAQTRDFVVAHRIDGRSYQEIAREHRVSVRTVEDRVAKAMVLVARWMRNC